MWEKQLDEVSLSFWQPQQEINQAHCITFMIPMGELQHLGIRPRNLPEHRNDKPRKTVCACGLKQVWFLEISLVKNWSNVSKYSLCILTQIFMLAVGPPFLKSRRTALPYAVWLICHTAQTQNYWSYCSAGIKALSEKPGRSDKDASPSKRASDEGNRKNLISIPPATVKTRCNDYIVSSCKKLMRGGFRKGLERGKDEHRRCSSKGFLPDIGWDAVSEARSWF